MTQIEKVNIQSETGSIWELKYYVQELGKAYGLKIERYAAGETVSEETCGITLSYEEAESMARKLAKGTVTPLSLHDVVDDLS